MKYYKYAMHPAFFPAIAHDLHIDIVFYSPAFVKTHYTEYAATISP